MELIHVAKIELQS